MFICFVKKSTVSKDDQAAQIVVILLIFNHLAWSEIFCVASVRNFDVRLIFICSGYFTFAFGSRIHVQS